jgi:putative aldouronate transport system substrate-binding protein
VDEGLVNRDFATLDSANWTDPFVQGKGGIIIDQNTRATDLTQKLKQKNPKDFDKVAMVGNLKRSDGRKFSLPFDGYNGVIAVSKQRVRTEKQLDDVLRALDKLESEEGSVLLTNGIQGRNFKLEAGHAALIDQDDAKVKVVQNDVDKAFIQLGTRASVGLGQYPPKYADEPTQKAYDLREPLMKEDLKTAVFNPALPVVSQTYIHKGGTLDPIVTDARIKYLSGEITEPQLREAVKRWYDSGGTQVAQETNELVAKLGK